MNGEKKKLYRSRTDRILFGVCGGLGDYFDIDPVLVRIVFTVLALVNGVGILLYIILLFVVPKEPGEDIEVNRAEKLREMVRGVERKTESVVDEVRQEVKFVKDQIKNKKDNENNQ